MGRLVEQVRSTDYVNKEMNMLWEEYMPEITDSFNRDEEVIPVAGYELNQYKGKLLDFLIYKKPQFPKHLIYPVMRLNDMKSNLDFDDGIVEIKMPDLTLLNRIYTRIKSDLKGLRKLADREMEEGHAISLG